MTHLAHRVRRMADALAEHRPAQTLSRNQLLARDLAGLAALLWTMDDVPFRKAADWANTGLVSGGGSNGSGSGPSRPTERTALAVELAEPGKQRERVLRDQEVASYDRWLRFYRGHLEDMAQPMAKILEDIGSRVGAELDHPGTTIVRDPITGRENRVPVCAEYFCDDPAPAPRRGRCEPCSKWQDRWLEKHPEATPADCPVVPKDVINSRRVARRRKNAA